MHEEGLERWLSASEQVWRQGTSWTWFRSVLQHELQGEKRWEDHWGSLPFSLWESVVWGLVCSYGCNCYNMNSQICPPDKRIIMVTGLCCVKLAPQFKVNWFIKGMNPCLGRREKIRTWGLSEGLQGKRPSWGTWPGGLQPRDWLMEQKQPGRDSNRK